MKIIERLKDWWEQLDKKQQFLFKIGIGAFVLTLALLLAGIYLSPIAPLALTLTLLIGSLCAFAFSGIVFSKAFLRRPFNSLLKFKAIEKSDATPYIEPTSDRRPSTSLVSSEESRRFEAEVVQPEVKHLGLVDPNEALLKACSEGDTDFVKELLSQGADIEHEDWLGYTPLFFAVRNGHTELVQLLLERGADCTHLHQGVFTTALHEALRRGRTEIALLLIKVRGLEDRWDEERFTPLHIAVWRNQPAVVEALLDAGANINGVHPIQRMTPLHYAASGNYVNEGIARILLARGADVSLVDRGGETALQRGEKAGQSWAVNFKEESIAAFTQPAELESPLAEFFKNPIYDENLTRMILAQANLMEVKEVKQTPAEGGLEDVSDSTSEASPEVGSDRGMSPR